PFGSNLKTEDYTDQGVRVIRLENIEHLDFIENKETYVSDEKHQKLIRHTVGEGDIIFSSFISENIRACLLPILKTKAIAKADCFCIRPDESIINKNFLLYILVSNITYAQLTSHIHGATRPRINTTQLKTITIPLVPLKEQEEIVKRVKSLFAKADVIEQKYQSFKQKIDTLPQALLHKAFKGELTEQLESDGDARQLLKEIEGLKAASGKVKKGIKVVKGYEENTAVLSMVAEPKEEVQSKVIKLKPTNSEIYKRTLLAAEIVYQLKETNTLGHLKLQKMLYLCQEIGSMNLPMNFLKQAMGPYDNQLARSIDKQFVVKKWFEYQNGALLKYRPLENCGNHKEDFQKYFEAEIEQINYLITKFKKFTSNQIEAVATLYACWKEAIEQNELITDKLIITKFYQWSKEKEKFREENMLKALDWMRRNGVEPK
ncbi:MAG TPA: restriction endonuclease subunit S, partial [Flavobacterium sp.]|nr:restriction endonuclease subunit S [Flavobacterium sp.]